MSNIILLHVFVTAELTLFALRKFEFCVHHYSYLWRWNSYCARMVSFLPLFCLSSYCCLTGDSGIALSTSLTFSGVIWLMTLFWTMFLLITCSFLCAGDGSLGESFSSNVNEARVMFKVLICGAVDLDPALPECFGERFVSDEKDLTKILRQKDPPPLPLEGIRGLNSVAIFEICLKNLWTEGMQLTMIPIAISANLKNVSELIWDRVTFHSRQKSQPVNIQLIGFRVCFIAQLKVINEAHDACDTRKKPDSKHK